MSVDKLRGSKHINRISPSDIGLLMSAQSYRPEITQAIRKIKSLNWSTLQKLVENTISPGPHPKYGGCYPCLKTKNVDGLLATHEPADYADVTIFKDINKVVVQKGDLLINLTGAGSIGRVSVYYGENNPITNQHIARMSVKTGTDEGYLVCFLRSWWGERALEQGVAGSTGQINMVNEHVRSIPVYLPDILAQKYIGDKVRQAELLRAWAKNCRGKIQDYFDGLFSGISLEKPEHHHTKVSLDILVPRLNAEYYSDYYIQVEKGLIGRFGKLTTLGRLAPTVRTKMKPSTDCIYKEIGDLDVGKGAFGSGTFYQYGEAPNNAQRIFDEGDVAVSTRRPNRGAIAVIEESSNTTFYSVFLARLKPKDRNFGYWLKEFLRHDAGKLLLLQRCTWTTYPVISEDDIETIPVPAIPDHWDSVARLSRKSVELEVVATNLAASAKTLVEALIEGQLTEQQLLQTQQALEDGDNSLDRAILSKLSAEGYAIEGATPLFSDMDELYRLLASAAQTETEE
ncbi:restriction endonuclease subunit S [Brenneria tiliae]|nr:restriction endonuclease subunit S [Brenneria tiliae]